MIIQKSAVITPSLMVLFLTKEGGGIRKAKINLANTYDQWVSSTWEQATIGSINSSNDRALPPETIPRLLEGNVHLRDV